MLMVLCIINIINIIMMMCNIIMMMLIMMMMCNIIILMMYNTNHMCVHVEQ